MIEIRNLTKRFGDFTAVDHLDLTIATGEFFGLLGPNGAGKTVVMILHDFESILHYADHVVLMAEGRVLTAGGAEEVLRSAEVREAFGVEPRFYETADGVHCYVKA